MKQLHKEGNKNFNITCTVCNRKDCDFEFTDSGMIIHCKACGTTDMIFR